MFQVALNDRNPYLIHFHSLDQLFFVMREADIYGVNFFLKKKIEIIITEFFNKEILINSVYLKRLNSAQINVTDVSETTLHSKPE